MFYTFPKQQFLVLYSKEMYLIFRFSTVAREGMACRIPSPAFDVFMLVCHVANLLYNKSLQRNGRSEGGIVALGNALWTQAHHIRCSI